MHTAYFTLRNILAASICLLTYLLCLSRDVGIMYANLHCYNCYYGPVIGIFIHFLKEILPEAICCLQTCYVDVVLLVMYCMCIPALIVTSANISKLRVYLCSLLIYCPRFVYKLVMFMPCC